MACKYTLDGQVLSELEFKQEVARRFANKPIDLNEIAKEFSKGKAIETPQAEPKVVEKQKGKEVEIHNELVDNLRGFNNNTTKKERTSEQGRIQKQKLIDRAEKMGYRAVEGKDGKLVIIDGKQKIGYRGDAIKKQSLEDKATKEDYRIAYEKALKAEPKDLRTAVMQFLLGGGKVKTSAFKREKRMSGEEYQEISWGLDENAPSLDDVARESFGDFIKGKQQDEADVMTAIADGLADARSKKELEAKFMSENESGEWTEMGLTKEQYQREISRRQEDERISKEEGLLVDDTKETFDDIDSKPITQEEIEKEYNDYQEYLKQKENGEANAGTEGTNGKNDAENKGSEKDSAAKKAESKVKEAYAEKIADADAKIEAAKEAKKAEVNALNKRANLFGGDTGAEKNKGLFGAQKDDYAQMDKIVAEYDKKIAEAENAKQKLIDEQEREIKNAVDIEGRQQKMELDDVKKELSSALKDLLDAGDITKLGFAAKNVGEKSAEALYKVHKALVKYAKVYISQGVTDVKQFAKKVGVSIKNAQQAWDEATGAKTYAKGELDYDLADISKTAIRRGINVREKLAEYKQKSKDIGKAVSDFIDDAEIKGALTATELKALVKKAANISTDKQFEKFTNYAEKVIGDANYAQEISDVKAQSKAARKGKHGRFTQMVKQFASIDPEVLTDTNLEKYKEAIDGLNERIPSYDKMAEHYNEIMVDVDAQGDNYSNVKTFNDASKKFADISSQSVKTVDDYRNLARNITGLKNRLKNLLADGDITQQEYTDIIDEIESKTSAVGGRLSAEIEALKTQQVKDIKSTPLDRSQLTPQENALLDRFNSLGAEDLKKLSVGELDLLQEAVSRVEQGFVPMQKVTDIVNRAEALKFAPKIVEELNAATKGDVAKAGLTRDMKINEAAFVSRILGVKEGGAVDRYIINPIVRQLSQSKKEISNAQKSFLDAKKDAFGLLTMPSTVKKSMNKLGLVFNMLQSKNGDAPADWVIMSGNEKEINKYVSQFEESKQAKVRASIKRQQNILEGNKKKQKIVKAAYDELLAKYDDGNGVIDLDKMKADIESGKGLSKAEQKLFDATNEIDNGLKNKQQAVNEMKGKEFAPIDYHLKRIELGRETELEKKEQGVRAKIEAGSAKSRTQKMPRAIETDLEKIVLGSIEETNTDYHATNATKYANEVIDEAALQGNFSNNALNAIRDNMQARINTEFVKSQTGGVLQKVLAARMAGSLVDVGRAVVETATAFTYTPLRAGNLKGYATFFNPAKRGLAHQLIMDTNSSLGLKHLNKNLEAGTEVNSKNLLVKIGEKVMTFPEHATLDMAWMPSFESAFEEITGEAFDGNKYKTDKSYREEHNQAILDAATEADVTAKQIVGGGLKFEGRQFIRILPEFAEKIGLPSSVDANSYPGKIAGFFGTYTARESKEFMDGFAKVYQGAKNKDIGTMGRGSGKVLGAALGAVGYGVGMGLYNSLWTKLTSDNEEYKKKAQGVIDSYYTWEGWTRETAAQLAFLGTSRYGAMGRFATLLGVSAAYNKTDDPKEKEQIKEFAQNQLFTRPLEAEGKYGEKDRDAAIMQKYVPYLSFPVEQLYKEGKSFFDLADVVKEKGFESLGKDDKDKFVAGELLFNSINMMLMFKGTQVPMTKKIEQFIAEHKKEQESSGGKPKMAKPAKAPRTGLPHQ